MLDTETKRRIDTARDILVGKLPDPKSQVEQITIALIYKFMDDMDKQSEELGGKPSFFKGEYSKYSWSKIFDSRLSGFEMFGLYSEAITRMSQNPNIPQLFRDIFKNAYLPYRDPETLKSFLKIINDFHYDHSEKLGDAFEYLLSVMGSQGDAGQFRTPRHIIDFIVKVIDPKKNETILDPACGTAGFLISAYKNIIANNKDDQGRLKLTPEERKKLVDNFVGYDISPDMVRLSLVNLYLHGFQNPHIYEYDTLTSEEKWNDLFDVVLANPPFMTPKGGIKPHKRFAIQANRSEVLFVDYIAEHLTTNGRAGIIVPEGIIFQSANAYQNLRKMLLDKYLWAVVSLPAGVFNPYSGVKTSILLLDKNISKKTKDIIFIKAENDGFGLGAQRKEIKDNDLHEALIILKEYQNSILDGKSFKLNSEIALVISKDKIEKSGDYGLSGDRYVEILQHKNHKWMLNELGEVCDIKKGDMITRERTKEGNVPVIAGGQQPAYYHNESNRTGETITVSASGAYAGFVNFFNIPIFASDCTTIKSKDEKKTLTKFIYYLLKNKQETIYQFQRGGGQPHVYPKDLIPMKFPLPPIEIQKEIVEKIEEKQKIIENAKELISNVERERANSREVFERLKCDWIKLESISDRITKGTTPTTLGHKFQSRGVNFIKIESINDAGDFLKEKIAYIDDVCHNELKRSQLKENDLLFSIAGAFGRVAVVSKEILPANTNQALSIISIKKEAKVLPKYLFYILKSNIVTEQTDKLIVGVAQYNLSLGQVSNIKIPLPDIETQKRLVARFDKQEEAIKANKALIEVMQENINEKISEVWSEDGP